MLLDLDTDTQNTRLPDGSRGPLKLHVMILAKKSGGAWRWLDLRAYMFRERPPQLH